MLGPLDSMMDQGKMKQQHSMRGRRNEERWYIPDLQDKIRKWDSVLHTVGGRREPKST